MEKYKEGWQKFIALCTGIKEEKNLMSFFDLVLTPEEKESISMRCLIIRDLLAREATQREIAKNLNVSIAKITRGSNELKRLKKPFTEYLKKIFVK